jgi:hypothetical protein
MCLTTFLALCVWLTLVWANDHVPAVHPLPFQLPRATCPFSAETHTPHERANAAVSVLLPAGRVDAALECSLLVLQDHRDGVFALSDAVVEAVTLNIQILMQILAPRNSKQGRFYHSMIGESAVSLFPQNSSDPVVPRPDRTIKVWDNALTASQCQGIVDLFERSDHFEGNVYSQGQLYVMPDIKKTEEYDASTSCTQGHPEWCEVDKLLTMVTLKHLELYAKANEAVRHFKNPMWDDGFTIKRYRNDGSEHHSYHVDEGQEPACAPRRRIAVLIYLNDVQVGGETVFLRQARAVLTFPCLSFQMRVSCTDGFEKLNNQRSVDLFSSF